MLRKNEIVVILFKKHSIEEMVISVSLSLRKVLKHFFVCNMSLKLNILCFELPTRDIYIYMFVQKLLKYLIPIDI